MLGKGAGPMRFEF